MKTISFERNENRITFTLAMSESEFNEHFAICHDCGSVVPLDSAIEYNGKYFCEDCTVSCFSCGEVIPSMYAKGVSDSSAIYCDYCWDEETYE